MSSLAIANLWCAIICLFLFLTVVVELEFHHGQSGVWFFVLFLDGVVRIHSRTSRASLVQN